MGDLRGGRPAVRTELHRAPLVAAAAAMVLGILAGRYSALPVGLWAFLGAVGLVTGALALLRGYLRMLSAGAVLVAVLCFGAVHVNLDYFAVAGDDVVTYTAGDDILATLRGRVVTSPAIYEDDPPSAYGYRRPPQTQFVIKVGSIRSGKGWLPASGLAGVIVHQADDRIRPGQLVEAMGWLGRVRQPDNPGQYDWRAAARANHTLAQLTVPAVDAVSILEQSPRAWYARVYWQLRSAARRHLAYCGDERAGQLLNALITGERAPALRSLNRTMMRAGIAHYLSISGMHLGVFLGFAYLVCRLLGLAPRKAAATVLVVLVVYMVLAQSRAPLVRSAIMAAALCLATIWGRRYAALNALAAAAIIVLLIEPMDLFDAGFQLSFGIVGGLLVLRRGVRGLIFGRWMRRRGLMVFRQEDRLRRWFNYTAANWAMDLVAIVIVAYVVSAPLVAYHFHFFSPYAAPLSALLLAPVTAVLVPGYVSTALAWPMPNLAYAVGRLAGQAADALARIVEAAGRLPGLSLELRDVSVGWVLLCYAAVAAVLLAGRLRWGKVLAAVALAVLVAATVYSQWSAPPPDRAELNVLAVGAGQCVVLRTPSGRVHLFDAGTRSGFDAYSLVLGPFLRSQRLPAPASAFISHPNTDHFSAMPEVVSRRRLEAVYVNEQFGASPPDADWPPADRQLLELLARRGVPVRRLAAGQSIRLDDRTVVEVLWPPAGREGLTANQSSLVLRITCDDASVLLPGDLEGPPQAELAGSAGLAANVLMLPHHGSWRPTLEEFVQAVSPRYVMASNSREPYGPVEADEPREFFDRLRRTYRYYTTPRSGWIQIRLGGAAIEVRTMRD